MQVNREQQLCDGRGFTVTGNKGFLQNFKEWVVRASVASPTPKVDGGPGWNLLHDGTGGANPYIIVSNHTAADISSNPNGINSGSGAYFGPHKILEVGMVDAAAGRIYVKAWLYWDDIGKLPYGQYGHRELPTFDVATFTYDFRGGDEFISIGANTGSWSFVSVGDFTGDLDFLEGPAKSAQISAGVSSGTAITITFATALEAQNFTKDKYYYLFDFNIKDDINYVQVTLGAGEGGLAANQIQVNKLTKNFSIGAVMSSYMHRFLFWATRTSDFNTFSNNAAIPYCSYKSTESLPDQAIKWNAGGLREVAVFCGYNNQVLFRASPDDEGNYVSEDPFIAENRNSANSQNDCNRAYGTPLGSISGEVWLPVSSITNLTIMISGRTVDGNNYVYVDSGSRIGASSTALLLPDFDAIS